MLTKIENSKIHAEDLSLMEDELLKIRTKITVADIVKNVCKYHKSQFDTEFSINYGRYTDHFKSHKNVVKANVHVISPEEFRLNCITYELLPGQKLCFCCKNKVFLEKEDKGSVEIRHKIHNENEVMETDQITFLCCHASIAKAITEVN